MIAVDIIHELLVINSRFTMAAAEADGYAGNRRKLCDVSFISIFVIKKKKDQVIVFESVCDQVIPGDAHANLSEERQGGSLMFFQTPDGIF